MQFFNRAAEGVIGYTDKELTTGEICSIDNLIFPEDRRRVVETVKHAVEERKPFSVEYKLRHKSGSICHLLERGEPVYGSDGKPLYIDGIIFDITERRRTEDALKESEAMFRCLAEEALVGVYLIRDGRYVYMNQKAAEMWGYSREELLNFKNVLEVVHPDDRQLVRENLRKRVEGDVKSVNYQLRIMKKDGSILFLHALGSSTMYKGEPVIIGTAIDVTESKRIEQRRADFYAMVSHDIKTPLTAILGNMQLLSEMAGKFDADTNEI